MALKSTSLYKIFAQNDKGIEDITRNGEIFDHVCHEKEYY